MGIFSFLFKRAPSTKTSQVVNTGNSSLLYKKLDDYTVIDLETSSKYSNSAKIIELAAARVRNCKVVSTYNTLINPCIPIDPHISAITSITNEMLSSAPMIEQKLDEYIDFIGNDVLVGHNIRSFDINVLNNTCSQIGHRTISNDMIDTLHYARRCDIDVFNYRLTTISRYFNYKYDAHRALNDCIANHNIYEKLKPTYNGIYHQSKDRSEQSRNNLQSCSINYDINGKSVVLTGDFEIALKEDIKEKLSSLGAIMKKDVSGLTDYLVVGNLGSEQWYYGSYGRKIEKAIELQNQGKPISIIEEDDFFMWTK